MTFLIKELGDYTKALATTLQPGSLVLVEGPYGRFNFNGGHQRQIWISAGIGITPFIPRKQQLSERREGRTIDLFHTTAAPDLRAGERLRRLATAADCAFTSGSPQRMAD
jgi:predicted ferric reductase